MTRSRSRQIVSNSHSSHPSGLVAVVVVNCAYDAHAILVDNIAPIKALELDPIKSGAHFRLLAHLLASRVFPYSRSPNVSPAQVHKHLNFDPISQAATTTSICP